MQPARKLHTTNHLRNVRVSQRMRTGTITQERVVGQIDTRPYLTNGQSDTCNILLDESASSFSNRTCQNRDRQTR